MRRVRASVALVLCALALLPACGNPAPAGGAPAASAPPGEDAGFRLEAIAGAPPGASAERLVIEGDRATMVRPEAVQEGMPIGLFSTTLLGGERASLESLVRAAAGRGGAAAPGGPAALIALESGGERVEVRLALPAPSPEASALLTAIDRIQQRALAAPLAAVRLELRPPGAPPAEGRPAPMRIALVNPGSVDVTIAFDAGGPRVEATEPRPPADPAVTPLPAVWDRVSPDAAGRGPFELPPGGGVEIAVEALFEDAGRFEVWARFEGGMTISAAGRDPIRVHGAAMSRPIAMTVAAR